MEKGPAAVGGGRALSRSLKRRANRPLAEE